MVERRIVAPDIVVRSHVAVPLPIRLAVGHRTLTPLAVVRIHDGQPDLLASIYNRCHVEAVPTLIKRREYSELFRDSSAVE